jgi:uncharacterized membrane protein (DUF373 family)
MLNAVDRFIRISLYALVLLLAVVLAASLFELVALVVRAVLAKTADYSLDPAPVERNALFLTTVQGFIAGVLLITILVELIRSLIEYLQRGSAEYVVVMFEIALIAVVRHLLALDFEHVDPLILPGLALLLGVLAYFNWRMSKDGGDRNSASTP